MKLFSLAFSLLSVLATALYSFNREADLYIRKGIHSPEFVYSVVTYPYLDQQFPIVVIYNPKRKMLWGPKSDLEEPISPALILLGNVPFSLKRHIEEMIPKSLSYDYDCYIDLTGVKSPETFEKIKPVYIADTIEDSANDSAVKELFSSPTLASEVFYYYLGDKYCRVRVLVNPEKRSLTTKKTFTVSEYDEQIPRVFTITWSSKYGIITDREAPPELLDHLSRLANMSCWDWYMNFETHNGTSVKYTEADQHDNTIETKTYSLDTWFNCSHDLE